MSVVVVTAVSAYSLMQMFALTGLLTVGGAAAHAIHSNKEAREALKRGLMAEIASESRRLDKICDAVLSKALHDELEAIKSAAVHNLNDDVLSGVFGEIHELSLKIRGAELDEKQCREREESILAGIGSIRVSADVSAGAALSRLAEEVKRVRPLPVEDRMANLRAIMDELAEIKESSGRKFMSEVSENLYEYALRSADERAMLIFDIRDLADRIACLDEIEGERLSSVVAGLNADTRFPERLKSLHRQCKTLWGKIRERAASTDYFRETLRRLRDDLSAARGIMASGEGAKLLERCDVLLGAKFIERPDFMALYEDMAKFVHERGETIADSMFAGKVKDVLETLGYEIVQDEAPAGENGGDSGAAASLEPGSVSYLDSPYEGYRVMLKADKKGSLAARLVRVEDGGDGASVGPDEKERLDRETGRKWCRDFDAFLDKMKDMGLPLDVSLRQEPEDAKLLTVEA
ncbi:MAG: hypothetical protein LBK91_00175, partial [Synergistaceae bacterium]|nr:hypothetical protein [Synergistaceae bacterium]